MFLSAQSFADLEGKGLLCKSIQSGKLYGYSFLKNFNYNIKPFKVSIGNELQHLKNKILNKIEQSPIFNV